MPTAFSKQNDEKEKGKESTHFFKEMRQFEMLRIRNVWCTLVLFHQYLFITSFNFILSILIIHNDEENKLWGQKNPALDVSHNTYYCVYLESDLPSLSLKFLL